MISFGYCFLTPGIVSVQDFQDFCLFVSKVELPVTNLGPSPQRVRPFYVHILSWNICCICAIKDLDTQLPMYTLLRKIYF